MSDSKPTECNMDPDRLRFLCAIPSNRQTLHCLYNYSVSKQIAHT